MRLAQWRVTWLIEHSTLHQLLWCIDSLCSDIREVRALTEEWIEEYNERRPNEALQNRTPSEWKQQIQP